jgi:hypothetical protein
VERWGGETDWSWAVIRLGELPIVAFGFGWGWPSLWWWWWWWCVVEGLVQPSHSFAIQGGKG